MDDKKNIRRWERQNYEMRLSLHLDNGTQIDGVSSNVSFSGLMFLPDTEPRELHIGETGILYPLPNTDNLAFPCKIVRQADNAVGINFIDKQSEFGMFITHDMMLDLLTRINNSFARSLDIEETLHTSVDHIKDYLQSKAASVFLLEEDNTKLVCKACAGPVDITGMQLDPNKGIVGYSIKEGQTIVIHDVQNDSRFAKEVDIVTGFKTESILCAPLIIQGRTIGALEVLNKSGSGLFAGHDRVVLTALASASAMAIENSRQAASIADSKNRIITLLRNIATGANRESSVEGACQVVLNEVCKYTGWPVGHAHIQSSDIPFRLIATGSWYVSDPEKYAEFKNQMENRQLLPGEGLAGHTWQTTNPEYLGNLSSNKSYRWPRAVSTSGLKTAYCYPVDSGSEMIAVLTFYSDNQDAPAEELHNILMRAVSDIERVYERQTIEEATRVALINSEQANQTKSDFLANISHELRTPLNAILGYTQMIQSETFGALEHTTYREYINHIGDSGGDLLEHINHLLNTTEIIASDSRLNEERLNIRNQLEFCISSLEHQAKENNIKITLNTTEDTPDLYADKKRFRQVIINLLINAIKYNRTSGIVALIADINDAGEVYVRVRDTGMGIEQTSMPRVLEHFGRKGSSRTSSNEGLGLGLTVVQIVASLHQADFKLESEQGLGTTATITFPKERIIRD